MAFRRTRFLLLLLIVYPGIAISQRSAVIRNVDFSLVENKLVITYEISDFKENDMFNIKAEIFKASGEKVDARTFYGDLNEVTKVTGNKIIWDIDKDNIILDDVIYVIVSGEVISAPIPEQIIKIPEKTTTSPIVVKRSPETSHRTAYFFESLILPGWGTSNLTGNNLHFIKGFLGYGSLAGSVLMALKANDSYDAYDLAITSSDRDKYFNEAKNRQQLSYIFAGAAVAVWSVDLITVFTAGKKTVAKPSSGISYRIGYSYAFGNNYQLTCKINF